jgi:hypothetical protein
LTADVVMASWRAMTTKSWSTYFEAASTEYKEAVGGRPVGY